MRGQYQRMLPFSLLEKISDWHMAAGISLGSQTWTGIARPNNPFTKKA